MNVNATRYWKATKVLLILVSPLQKVAPDPGIAHNACNKQAIQILFNDRKFSSAEFVRRYLKELDNGVKWADYDFKNSSHFYNPISGRGLWRWPNAITESNLHFSLAKQYCQSKNYEKAMFYLGAAVHLIQDMCVPHHARGSVLNGHQFYEDWVEKHYKEYLVDKGGIYHLGVEPSQWIRNNANFAYGKYHLVEGEQKDYHSATLELLVLAQKTTAGFFNAFYEEYIEKKVNLI